PTQADADPPLDRRGLWCYPGAARKVKQGTAIPIRSCQYFDHHLCVVRGRPLCRDTAEWLLPRHEHLRMDALGEAAGPTASDGGLFDPERLVYDLVDRFGWIPGIVFLSYLFYRFLRAGVGRLGERYGLGRYVV